MKLYKMEDIIETLISVPDIKGAPYIELEEKLLDLKPAMIIPECGGCMGASYNPRDCEECNRRNNKSMDFFDRTDIAEVERDAFERGYKAANKEKIMGRDLISREEATAAIKEAVEPLMEATSLRTQQADICFIRNICCAAVDNIQARIPTFETFCGVDIRKAAFIVDKYKKEGEIIED